MTTKVARLASLNEFDLNIDRVYQPRSKQAVFNYTDGLSSEKYLFDVLSNAKDLSSSSPELEAKVVDWPSEYHLSSTRANLLRSLDLSDVNRILELGCGCGSITRYLGEQEHIQVDAVEGSPSRAALARLRCKDQQNVEISSANFNEIDIPIGEYDLVLFVGVTEYAGRFAEGLDDVVALQRLLALAKSACNDKGVVLVAIENRLGMKYALGASEDHYASRYVGLDNYPNSEGIRTYSKLEWIEQIEKADFSQYRLMLPFPDYKIPTLVTGESIDAASFRKLAARLSSRDYVNAFSVGDSLGKNEVRVWDALAQAGTIADHSNSFLWLMANDHAAIAKLLTSDVSSFEAPEFDYQLDKVNQPQIQDLETSADEMLIEHLNAQIVQLQSHSKNLEDKVDIMSNSVGWRLLNGLRRILRKNTL
ncbi:MAG: class I SAM-dependent methyltransferase [Gammaproteobacteria bacterium]|nr:class I SAM-dependent methyltransferase [Gammaproteobacteria bacterium]